MWRGRRIYVPAPLKEKALGWHINTSLVPERTIDAKLSDLKSSAVTAKLVYDCDHCTEIPHASLQLEHCWDKCAIDFVQWTIPWTNIHSHLSRLQEQMARGNDVKECRQSEDYLCSHRRFLLVLETRRYCSLTMDPSPR